MKLNTEIYIYIKKSLSTKNTFAEILDSWFVLS